LQEVGRGEGVIGKREEGDAGEVNFLQDREAAAKPSNARRLTRSHTLKKKILCGVKKNAGTERGGGQSSRRREGGMCGSSSGKDQRPDGFGKLKGFHRNRSPSVKEQNKGE